MMDSQGNSAFTVTSSTIIISEYSSSSNETTGACSGFGREKNHIAEPPVKQYDDQLILVAG